MFAPKRTRLLHAYRCVLRRAWHAYRGSIGHLRHRRASELIFHSVGNIKLLQTLAPYESAWLVLAVLLDDVEGRNVWLAQFQLREDDLWSYPLMLADDEQVRVSDVMVQMERCMDWEKSLAFSHLCELVMFKEYLAGRLDESEI